MVGWHHQRNGHELEQAPGVGDIYHSQFWSGNVLRFFFPTPSNFLILQHQLDVLRLYSILTLPNWRQHPIPQFKGSDPKTASTANTSLKSRSSPMPLGDLSSIPELGRSSGEGNGNPLQYSGLENSMGCTVHGIALAVGEWKCKLEPQ